VIAASGSELDWKRLVRQARRFHLTARLHHALSLLSERLM